MANGSFWNKLLTYDDINGNSLKPDLHAKVPAVWNTYEIDGENLPGFGYATYRLRVENAVEGQELAIRICS